MMESSNKIQTTETPKINLQDQRDLERFTRSLSHKIVQVIVQSRLGEKIKTHSHPHSTNADWQFNLAIKDLPEVNLETKRALERHLPSIGLGMCVEISIKTSEGDTLVLEAWYLEMTNQRDPNARVTYTVYNRMSVMLKSLIVLTRVTPAHKLSSLQGPGSFVVCYRVYMGEPHYNSLGLYQRLNVGRVGTPVGTLNLSVLYRTQLTIEPQKCNRDGMFMVKSDHFNPDFSPKIPPSNVNPNQNLNNNDQKSVVEELADACEECNEEAKKDTNTGNSKKPTVATVIEEQINLDECLKMGAFVEQCKTPENGDYIMPVSAFDRLLNVVPLSEKTASHLNSLNNRKLAKSEYKQENEALRPKGLVTSCIDDFVMVDLKPPFACGGEEDLSVFFRECQTAPQLVSFSEQPSLADQVDDLILQLEKFETSVPELNDFVESLCSDEASK